MEKNTKQITILEKPLSKGYKYFGIYFQKFIDKQKKGLTPLTATRYLQHYIDNNKVGLSSKNNCRKAIIHIVKLTLVREGCLEQIAYYREALKIIKIRHVTKTVMPPDVPTHRDVKLAKINSPIKPQLLIDFINITALRLGEVIRIKLTQCRYDEISNGYSIKFVRKGGNDFYTWIPKELFDRILIEFDSTIWLFQSPYTSKSHLTHGTAQKWLRDASRFTTRPIRPHLIRHKAINEIVEENPHIPLHILCEAFGHSEKTLKAYYLNKGKTDVTEINKKHYLTLRENERNQK